MIRERLSKVLVKMQLKTEYNIVAEQNILLCHHPQHDEKKYNIYIIVANSDLFFFGKNKGVFELRYLSKPKIISFQ
jgi:hypothetical protein